MAGRVHGGLRSLRRAAVSASALLVVACAGEAQAPLQAAIDGRAVYERDCLACHMSSGGGVPGMTPALTGSPWVTGAADALIGYVLTGGFGPQVLMASFDYLTDGEMAAVLTYVRDAFGDGAPAITLEEVRRMRAQVDASE